MKKTWAIAVGIPIAIILGLTSLAVAETIAWKEPAKSYGGCVSKTTGYLRVLERNDLPKSVNGKCKSTERKVTLYSRAGVDALIAKIPAAPAKMQFIFGGTTAVCTRGADVAKVPAYACVAATPSPSPSATPTS